MKRLVIAIGLVLAVTWGGIMSVDADDNTEILVRLPENNRRVVSTLYEREIEEGVELWNADMHVAAFESFYRAQGLAALYDLNKEGVGGYETQLRIEVAALAGKRELLKAIVREAPVGRPYVADIRRALVGRR